MVIEVWLAVRGGPCIIRLCMAVFDATNTDISHWHYLGVEVPWIMGGTRGSVVTGGGRETVSVRMLLLVLVVPHGKVALALTATILILAGVGAGVGAAEFIGTSCFVSALQIDAGTEGGLANAMLSEPPHQVRWDVVWHLAKVFGPGPRSPGFDVETTPGRGSTLLPHAGVGLRAAPVVTAGVRFRVHTAGAVVCLFGGCHGVPGCGR